MKPADNIEDPFFVTDVLGVVYNIANTGMRAAGNDHQAIGGFVYQGRIVLQELRNLDKVMMRRNNDRPFIFRGQFEIVAPRDLTQENKAIV